MSFCLPQKIFKPLYKFCNILILGRAGSNKNFAGQAGNFGLVDTFIVYEYNQTPLRAVNLTFNRYEYNIRVYSKCI